MQSTTQPKRKLIQAVKQPSGRICVAGNQTPHKGTMGERGNDTRTSRERAPEHSNRKTDPTIINRFIRDTDKSEKAFYEQQLKDLQKEQAKIKNRLDVLLNLVLDGTITKKNTKVKKKSSERRITISAYS